MTSPTATEPVSARARVHLDSVVVRLIAVISAAAGTFVMRHAAGGLEPAIWFIVISLATCAALFPDSHLGLVVVAVYGSTWAITVEHAATAWAIGAAATLGTFHTALAAATVAPLGASWSPGMRRRWRRRGAIVAIAGFGTWSIGRAADTISLPASSFLVTTALFLVAAGAAWARTHSIDE